MLTSVDEPLKYMNDDALLSQLSFVDSVNPLSAKSPLNWPCNNVSFEIVERNQCRQQQVESSSNAVEIVW